jgi:hypothetical protein
MSKSQKFSGCDEWRYGGAMTSQLLEPTFVIYERIPTRLVVAEELNSNWSFEADGDSWNPILAPTISESRSGQ